MVYRYNAKPLEAAFYADPQQHVITADKKDHRMGGVTVQLPENGCRVPLENDCDTMALCSFTDGVCTHGLFYHRIDEDADSVLEMACRNTLPADVCSRCVESRYLTARLQPAPGDVLYGRAFFPYKSGVVHYLKSTSSTSTPYYVEYQSLYFPAGIGNGPAIVLNHCIDAPQPFCHRAAERQDIPDFSALLYQTLETVMVGPDR